MWRPAGSERGVPHSVVDYEVTERTEDFVSLILRGELTGERPVEHFKRDLERHYVDDGVRRIQVEMQDLTALSLEGCAVLLELYEESHRRGKDFVLVHPTGQVRDKLAMTGLLKPLGTD